MMGLDSYEENLDDLQEFIMINISSEHNIYHPANDNKQITRDHSKCVSLQFLQEKNHSQQTHKLRC